jgi:hypothetical protein
MGKQGEQAAGVDSEMSGQHEGCEDAPEDH